MNSVFKDSPTWRGAALAESLAPGEIEPSLVDWLTDSTIEIPEAQLMGVLDDFPHDETVHGAIIARPYLSEAVIVRLVALVSQALFDSLISRHPLPERYRREVTKGRPGRPEWWARGLLNIGH